MKTILRISTTLSVLVVMLIIDIPILPVELVPEAQAILGVRRRTARRTAVVVSSADAAAVATSQQQAAAQQQAAVAQQQAAAAQAAGGVPVGTVVQALPAGCKAVTVGNTQYQDCGGSFYKTAFQGNNLVYVVVQNPL
jgi:nucleoid-associated protein YgaU